MANCCMDTVVFYPLEGFQENFDRLKEAVNACFDTSGRASDNSIGQLFIHAGLPVDGIHLRGTVIHKEIQDTHLSLWSDTCWTPLSDAYWVISEFYNVGYVYCAEEPGNGIYINTDEEGRFLDARYKVVLDEEEDYGPLKFLKQNIGNDTDIYFSSEVNVLRWFEENGNITASSIEELDERLNDYVSIHKFMLA